MKLAKSTLVIGSLIAASLAIGCASQTAEADPAAENTATSKEAVQARIDVFVDALVRHDVATLESIVSSEILARSVERHLELPAFLEKQRGAMMRTFDLSEDEQPAFEVTSIADEGDAVRVTLALRGEELKKPFYFVREGGELKLNIAPPGFSKDAPSGTLFGRSRYAVKNENVYGNPAVTMTCYRSGGASASVTVASGSRGYVDCDDTCGRWWSGSTFQAYGAYDGPQRKCDWNSWGDDVYIDVLSSGGWRCNDPC